MKTFVLPLLVLFFITSCSVKNTSGIKKINNTIQLKVLPSSGGSYGYNFIIRNDSLEISQVELTLTGDTISFGQNINSSSYNLSPQQIDTLNTLLENCCVYFHSNIYSLDTWTYILIINNKEVRRFDSFTLNETDLSIFENNYQEIIQMILNISESQNLFKSFAFYPTKKPSLTMPMEI